MSVLSPSIISLQHRHRLVAMAALSALLSACGGGDGDSSSTAGISGPMGQVTALTPQVLQSGTYTISNCINESEAAVARKLRLGTDGSVALLDADRGDAVLVSFTPSTTERQYRELRLNKGDWSLEYAQYRLNGTLDVEEINFTLSPTGVNIISRNSAGDAVVVASCAGNNGQEVAAPAAAMSTLAQPAAVAKPVILNIPVTLTEAAVAQRLASAVAVNNPVIDLQTSGTLNTGINHAVTFTKDGKIITQEGSAAPYTWAGTGTSWLSNGVYVEYYESDDTPNAASNNAGTPANPWISGYVTNFAVNEIQYSLERNTSANSSPANQVSAGMSLSF